ncbi:hypothetical protein K438DRAFT_2150630 [Mycena galopus ATCC 62051]|nr:hypothetical protein K438DRAFT_2150630 [Mycena galopus ATCC 62051]
MARIILPLVSVLLLFEVMAAPLTRRSKTGDGLSNEACFEWVSRVQTNTSAATNIFGDINPKYVPRFFLGEVTDELMPIQHGPGDWRAGATQCAARTTPHQQPSGSVGARLRERRGFGVSVADVVSALRSAQSAMSGVTAGAFGDNAEIRNAEMTVKLIQGNQDITQAISQAQKAVAANCTTAYACSGILICKRTRTEAVATVLDAGIEKSPKRKKISSENGRV